MNNISKNMIILAIGQALTTTVVSLLTLVSSLSGNFLAPLPSLSTLPVTATVIGTMCMIYPASIIMGKLGRKKGFMFKASIGFFGGLICYLALFIHNFYILILGTFILGVFSSFGQYYRFAAIEVAKNEEEKHIAISVVTGAGVIGGIVGPFLGGSYAQSISNTPYGGAFIVLSVVCILLAISQFWLSSDLGKIASITNSKPEKFKLNQPFYLVTLICAIGFSVMTLVMNAAPISLHHDGFNLRDTALVLQIHFILMYIPSFFNPSIIKRIGINGLISVGAFCSLLASLLSFYPEQTKIIYIVELGLAGVGWNFIFNGGTLLLVDTYSPNLKVKAQGINSLFVYSANVFSSFGAGFLITQYNWKAVNSVCIPLLILVLYLIAIKKVHKFKLNLLS